MADFKDLTIPTEEDTQELINKKTKIDESIEYLQSFIKTFSDMLSGLNDDTLDDIVEINGDNLETAQNETDLAITALTNESAELQLKIDKQSDLSDVQLAFDQMNKLKEFYNRKIDSINEGEAIPDYEGINSVFKG